eukprot:2773903-Rhodomonas_salina.1
MKKKNRYPSPPPKKKKTQQNTKRKRKEKGGGEDRKSLWKRWWKAEKVWAMQQLLARQSSERVWCAGGVLHCPILKPSGFQCAIRT